MVNLDSRLVYNKYDKSNLLGDLKAYPSQCKAGWDSAAKCVLPANFSQIDKVVILGMGGSAIGGEVAGNLVMMESKVPVWSYRDYGLPAFIDENTLVIAVSYSGNTEETLSGFTKLVRSKAKKIVFTSGGKLAALARKQQYPLSIIEYHGQPRTLFPYMVSFIIGIFYKLGLLKKKVADVSLVIPALNQLVNDLDMNIPMATNPAKQLAKDVYGKLPVVYGAGFLSGVARRWKSQFNENSKSFAFYELFPELLHNAAVGYVFPSEITKNLVVVLLRSNLLHPRVLVQYDAILKVLEEKGIKHLVVDAKGMSVLEQTLTVTLLGDFTSYYLAIKNGIDPSPVQVIDFIKKYQAEH